MQADFAEQLFAALSQERLSAYQSRVDEDGHLNLFSHYAWNVALSESLVSDSANIGNYLT